MQPLPETAAAIADDQGWDDESIIIHLCGFIAQKGLEAELEKYFVAAAAEENGEANG